MGYITYLNSLSISLHNLFKEDEKLVLLGEDVLDPYGGAFKVTKGLSTLFPDRIIITPISEAAIVGIGAGLAMNGIRCIVEIMFGDFILLAADQIMNQISKVSLMYNKKIDIPLVIRTPMGGYRGYGPTHSQSLESMLISIPNLKIISPNLFHDPGALLKKSLYLNNPVLFVEHKANYPLKLISSSFHDFPLFNIEVYNQEGFPVNCLYFDEESIPDIVAITYGYVSNLALEAARQLFFEEEINVHLYVLSNINNWDVSFIDENAKTCGKFLVIEEGLESGGWGAVYSSVIFQIFFEFLKAPVKQLGNKGNTIPNALNLEAEVLPSINSMKQSMVALHNI